MAEYFDLGVNLMSMINDFYARRHAKATIVNKNDDVKDGNLKTRNGLKWIDPCMFEVRQSVCVVGINRDAVLKAKTWISSLAPESLAIESFHVRNAGDVKDGALLVPKVILVAKHCPGRKLIDHSTSNAGQLDFLYDEVCRVRADVLVIYMDLPRCIYPPNKCFVYHEKISELLFRDQPVLKELALENELITITESDPSTAAVAKPPQGLNNIQRNVIREWLQRPVRSDHGVYRAATDYLSDSMPRQRPNDCCYYSESEVTAYQLQQSGIPRGLAIGWGKLSSGFASATESRRRSDDVGFETSNMNAKRKRKSYGSVTSSATGGSSVSRRQRRDDSDELLKPLMETNNGDDDTQELIALDDDVDGKDNLGFVRDCLSNTNSVMTTYQL